MEENTKKRSRKSKLVLRDCMDSDDENIAFMQQEIETALAQMKNKSILKKLGKVRPTPKPLQFSVKVEVEEVNETHENGKSLNIQIGSVKSLAEPNIAPRTNKGPEDVYFRISPEMIRQEFERLSRETTSAADKLIELNMRNLLGKKKKIQESHIIDDKLQGIFRKSWKNWRHSFPNIREMPAMYKCYTCNRAWWYFHDFREHVLRHKKVMAVQFHTIHHECYILAFESGTLDLKEKRYSVESNCWRCNKDITKHITSSIDKTMEYRCNGCKEKFYTCSLLFDHENNCSLHKKLIVSNTLITEVYACSLCPAKLGTAKELLEHMVLRHSVRSDLPEDWVLRVCSQCDYPFHLQALHDCPLKPVVASCKFCLQKFTSHTLVLIHLNATQHHYPCKVCGMDLLKQCMELLHLVEHTENYITLFKCINCKDSIYFPTVNSINKHKVTVHGGLIESKSLGNCYEEVVVPRRLAVLQPGIKHIQTNKNQENRFNKVSGGLSLGEPSGSSTDMNIFQAQAKAENKIKCHPTRGRPRKVPDIKIQENDIIDISSSDSSTDDEEEDVKMCDRPQDPQENSSDVITLDNCPGIISDLIKKEPDDTDICIDNQEDAKDHMKANTQESFSVDIDTSINIKENENTEAMSTDTINNITPTEINEFDPYLVIKEEKIEYTETRTDQHQNEQMPIIKIENAMRIKEEPMDIVQEDDNAIKGNSNIRSNMNKTTNCNKTSVKLSTNIKKMRANLSDKLRNNIEKLRANTQNEELRANIQNEELRANIENEELRTNIHNEELRGNIENEDLRTNIESEELRDNIENEELRANIENVKLRFKIVNDKNTTINEVNSTNVLGIPIKEELDTEYFDINAEELTYEIKEENLEELTGNNMIILDPNNSVSIKYEIDPASNTSETSDEVDLQILEPEVVVYHSFRRKKVYKCCKCQFKGHHNAYKQHIQAANHDTRRAKKQCHSRTVSNWGSEYFCTKCDVSYPTWYKYILHFSKVHNYESQLCPKCFRPCHNMTFLQSHLHTHIKESFVNIYIIKAKEENDPDLYSQQCKTCSEKVKQENFFEHWESHLEIMDVTKSSEESQWKGFMPAMEHKHELRRMLLLLQGIHPSSSPDEKHNTRLRYCFKCKRKFERKNECKRHFIEHLLMDAYLDRHKYGFLRCQICSADFHTSERYKRHMRDHGSLPLYKCELCDKAFSDSSNFTKHKKVHNLSCMTCDICNKKFTGKAFLEKHMRMHETFTPLECQDCNKKFYTESSYKKHVSRGKARYKCIPCHIFFNTLREKWDHMWEVHRERKIQADCPICKKSFRKHQDVRKHMREEHKNEPCKYVPDKTLLKDSDGVVYMDE